jgi:hypothetical protein
MLKNRQKPIYLQTNKQIFIYVLFLLSKLICYLLMSMKTKQNKNPIAIAKYKSFEIESVSSYFF